MSEPVILINGRRLTDGQAMAVRVAITTFHQEMAEPDALGGDEHGKRMAEGYRDRLTEVLRMLVPPVASASPATEAGPIMRARTARILQLAGVVPENATAEQRELADGYAIAELPIDEAAACLMWAMK